MQDSKVTDKTAAVGKTTGADKKLSESVRALRPVLSFLQLCYIFDRLQLVPKTPRMRPWRLCRPWIHTIL